MLNKLLQLMRCYHMLQPGDQLTCAVSGGADSMALLWAMYLMKDKLQISLAAAHFNHGLRGEESDRDEAFVRQFCQDYQIPFVSERATVVAGKKGLEAAARDARYAFLKSLPGKIATAHTANDNAETVLMHLVRGTGLKGLGAIAPVNGKLIRPMLTVTRQNVEDFLGQYHIAYVTDSSNGTDAFLRNRLRHHVMPLLERENPKLTLNLSAMAMELREDEAALSAPVQPGTKLQVASVRDMLPAHRKRAIMAFLETVGVKEPEREHIALVEELVFSVKPSAKASLPNGVTIARCYGFVQLWEAEPSWMPEELPCPGAMWIPELDLQILCKNATEPVKEIDCFTVKPTGTIVVRTRQEGDTMRLPGGTKSLKKLFIDKKIPASERHRIPVIADEMGVLGVYGIGANLDRIGTDVQICFQSLNEKRETGGFLMRNDIKEVLLTQEQIQAKVQELAAILTKEYAGKNPVFVGVMKGVVMFFADVVKLIDTPCQIDFMWISSYGSGTSSSGKMDVKRDVSADLKGRHVVILEDIFDTGNSLNFTYNHLLTKEPASLKICTLLDKPERRNPDVTLQADYVGFVIPNEFVVGYGLDYDEYYRNLPYIGILKPEVYTK